MNHVLHRNLKALRMKKVKKVGDPLGGGTLSICMYVCVETYCILKAFLKPFKAPQPLKKSLNSLIIDPGMVVPTGHWKEVGRIVREFRSKTIYKNLKIMYPPPMISRYPRNPYYRSALINVPGIFSGQKSSRGRISRCRIRIWRQKLPNLSPGGRKLRNTAPERSYWFFVYPPPMISRYLETKGGGKHVRHFASQWTIPIRKFPI